MTIVRDDEFPEFDEDPALEADDRAQPLAIDVVDAFVVLRQWDGDRETDHCILIERRDLRELLQIIAEECA